MESNIGETGGSYQRRGELRHIVNAEPSPILAKQVEDGIIHP